MQGDLLLLACAAVWGLAFYFQKRAMEHIGPQLFIVARSVLATMVLAPLAWREWRSGGWKGGRKKFVKTAMLAGAGFYGGALFQQAGIVTATMTNSGFLTSLYVVLTPLVAWAAYRRAPTRWVWVAVGLSMAGTWLLGGGTLSAFSKGDVLVAVSAVFWAVYVVIVGFGAGEGKPSAFNAIQFVVVAALAAAGVGLTEEVSAAGLWRAGVDLLFVGVLSSALMFTLFSAAMRVVPATETAVIASLEALFAALAAWWLLGERLPPTGWAGAVLLMAATVVVHLPGAPANVPPKADDVKKRV